MITTTPLRRFVLTLIVLCAASLHAQQTTNETHAAIKRLLPSFGRVAQLKNSIVRDGRVDLALMGLTDKLEKLGIQLLDLGKESSSFARLPEMVQQVSAWQVRPDCFILVPENSVTVAEVQKLLGKGDAAATKDSGLLWHHYGVYDFGVTNDIVRAVRITFPTPAKIKPDKTEK
jgi:hypothetical protein